MNLAPRSNSSVLRSLVGAALLVFLPAGFAQTVSVTDTTGWTAWKTPTGANVVDPAGDQQTGQGADDFVGDTTYAGFYQKAGQITGLTGDYLLLRARMNKFDGADQWGNGGNWGVGIDIDLPGTSGYGSVDIVMMMSEGSGNANNRTRTVTFGDPGTGANTSPNTTSWTFPGTLQAATGNTVPNSTSLVVNQTYDVMQATDGSAFSGTADALITFAISFSTLQAAIRHYTSNTGFVMDYTTKLSFVSFTSTQDNALNQDLFGTSGNLSSTATWNQLGAFTAPLDAYGRVPELATYAQMAMLLLAGAVVGWRIRRRSTQDSARQ